MDGSDAMVLSPSQEAELSLSELVAASELTSLNFGLVQLTTDERSALKELAVRIVAWLQSALLREEGRAEILLKLGHVHLLLHEFEKALSAYQKYHRMANAKRSIYSPKKRLECRTMDASFLYGLALVYQHFEENQWAYELFLQLLYLHPSFPLSREVHVQLGSALSERHRDLQIGLGHLNTALSIKQKRNLQEDEEIHFAIAHLNQVCNEKQTAVKQYLKLLQDLEPSLELEQRNAYQRNGEPSFNNGKDNKTKRRRRLVAETHRQLGWLYFSGVYVDEDNKSSIQDVDRDTLRLQCAVKHLQRSIELQSEIGIMSSIGQSLYLLGRCYASMNKVHEAFVAYRNSVDKSESNADTWCSIGILYQQQNQPMDALQAYICAVQLDKNHFSAWLNLGILYESALQFHDALVAYNNANSCKSNEGKDAKSAMQLFHRLQLIQNKVSSLSHGDSSSFREAASRLTGRKPLPSVEEAWDLPILNEMSGSRQQQNHQHNGTVKVVTATRVHSGPDSTRRLMMISRPGGPGAPTIMAMRPAVTVPNGMMMVSNIQNGLSVQQMQQMQYLQSLSTLTPQQQMVLHQLQTLHKQHQMKVLQQQQHPQQAPQQHMTHQHLQQQGLPVQSQQPQPSPSHPQQHPQPSTSGNVASQSETSNGASNDILQDKDITNMSDTELEALISQQDIGSFAESLLKQIQENDSDNQHNDQDEAMEGILDIKKELEPGDKNEDITPSGDDNAKCTENTSTKSAEQAAIELKLQTIPQDLTHVAVEEGDWPNCDTSLMLPRPAETMDTASIVEYAKSIKFVPRALFLPIAMQAQSCVPQTPKGPPNMTTTGKEQLLPPTPTVLMDSKKNVASPQLQDFCLKHPVTVVRGIAGALKLDCGLFATKHLLEMHSKHSITVLSHPKPLSENEGGASNETNSEQDWKYERVAHMSTIGEYANYQSNSFNEGLKLEQERITGNRSTSTDADMDNEGTSSGMRNKRKKSTGPKSGSSHSTASEPEAMIYSAPNIELRDQREFRAQLAELMKLPPWLRTVSARNLLSHLGYSVSRVQLEMTVPGARKVAMQDRGQGCVVNINVGPGDCEWFSVPPDHWQTMLELCRSNNVNFNHGEWWPSMRDLMQRSVPVYRFLQRPGDLVWVNAGSIFWVQAVGWLNSVQWTVAPLSHSQFELMLHKYEWNRLHSVKNSVPMIHLAWQLSQNVRVEEQAFFNELRAIMVKSLAQFAATQTRVKALQAEHSKPSESITKKGNESSDEKKENDAKDGSGKPEKQHQLLKVVIQIRKRADPVYFCSQCQDELFGSVFIEAESTKPLCYFCARKRSPKLKGFVCLEEFRLPDLTQALNNFRLHEKNPISNLISSSASSPSTNQKPNLSQLGLSAMAQGMARAHGAHNNQLASALQSYLTNAS